MLHALGPKYGIDANQVTEGMLAMPEWNELNSQLYMHTVVPNLIRLGLITERTRDKWIACGMLVESQLSGKSVPLSN
jgi:hypothetical protein